MDEGLREFYLALPRIEDYPDLYIPGYTEALKTYTGVRVVPSYPFLEGFNLKEDYRKYLVARPAPYYFVPIHRDNRCYGFVIKSVEKPTPRFCTNYYMPGIDKVEKGKPVIFVEGFKDTFVFRHLGYNCMPMLTSVPTQQLMSFMMENQVKVIFIPDNDEHRDDNIKHFKDKVKNYSSVYIMKVEGHKDFGDFFSGDKQVQANVVNNVKKIAKLYKYLLEA